MSAYIYIHVLVASECIYMYIHVLVASECIYIPVASECIYIYTDTGALISLEELASLAIISIKLHLKPNINYGNNELWDKFQSSTTCLSSYNRYINVYVYM